MKFQFKDYEDDKLLKIFAYKMNKRYNNKMEVKDRPSGFFVCIVTGALVEVKDKRASAIRARWKIPSSNCK